METTTASITVEEYLAQETAAEYKSEYHDGVIIPMAGGSLLHNRVKGNVYSFFDRVLDAGYAVWNSDTQVHIPATNRNVYPDVMVVVGATQADTTTLLGVMLNPTLIVEVLSASTRSYDMGEKFAHYQTIPTFREYLLIDPDRIAVTHWVRTPAGEWQRMDYTNQDAVITLVAVPAALPLQEVYRRVTGDT